MAHPNTLTSWHPWTRPLGRALAAAMLFNALAPLAALAQSNPVAPAAQQQVQRLGEWQQRLAQSKHDSDLAQQSASDSLDRRLERMQDLVGQLARPGLPAETQESLRSQLGTEIDAIVRATEATRAEFDTLGAALQQKGVSAEILRRHQAAVAQFEARATDFMAVASQWATPKRSGLFAYRAAPAPAAPALQALGAFLTQNRGVRNATPIDPNKLPWDARKPVQRPVAAAKALPLNAALPAARLLPAKAGGDAPTALDLAETDEVQLTPAVRAQAAALGHNPVNIANWVRNHIEFAPTWGAIQSAQDTLDKGRGNAFDTASLLVALLRAAGIPARYQLGTIDIPSAQLMNWVGQVNSPAAAQQILGQGGIAATGLVRAGQVESVRMDHVWVQAYVNWMPGRGSQQGGAIANPPLLDGAGLPQHANPNPALNAWVALDASFKQYDYPPAIDLARSVPMDAAALASDVQAGARIDTAQGWVQNPNLAAVQRQLANYQTRLLTHIQGQPAGANTTVGDVVGRKIIAQQIQPMLAGTTPYAVHQLGQQTPAVPAALQHRFTYRLYASEYDRASDNPLLEFTEKIARLGGKRITLGYAPASQADSDLLASYLPRPHADGSPVLPGEFPSSLPAYLFRLTPQISVDGQVVARGNDSVGMGADLYSTGGFTQLYDPSQWDLGSEESNIAGQATAIGISAGGIGAGQLARLKERMQATKQRVDTANAANLAALQGEQVAGDLLTAVIWSWFAASENHNQLAQKQAGMVENPGLSYGLFHAVAEPLYSWGVVRKITFPGVNLDIGHVRNLSWSKDNNPVTWVAYNRLRGQYMSALEAALPERFFSDPNQCRLEGAANPNPNLPACAQGISAVKALAVAAQAGQKVYTLTPQVYQANPGIVSSALGAHSSNTRNKVQQSLDAGLEVVIHEAPVVQDGWRGAGYTVIDTSTGAGAYLIEGGSNGGTLIGLALGLVAGIAVIVASPVVAGLVGAIGLAIGAYYALTASITELLNFSAARLIATVAGIALAVILGGYVTISFPLLFVLGFMWLLFTVIRVMIIEIVTAESEAARSRNRHFA